MSEIAEQTLSLPGSQARLDHLLQSSDAAELLGVRISALTEIIVFLAFVVGLSIVTGDGTRFMNASLHPFSIIVLLVSVQYGLKEALAAALLASVFLLVGNLPEQTMTESSYEYVLHVFSRPLLWTTAALILGGIRERQLSERRELIDGLKNIEDAASIIIDGYQELKQTKEQLEMRLAEERCSLLAVYTIAQSLETLDSKEALKGSEKLIRTALNPGKFSLFKFEDECFSLYASYGWEPSDGFRVFYDAKDALTREVVDKKTIVSVTSRRGEKLLDRQGLMAGPIFDERTGRVFGMLKIEEADFIGLGLRTFEMFKIVSAWIARTASHIDDYQSRSRPPKAPEARRKREDAFAGQGPSTLRRDAPSGVSETLI